MFRIDKEIEDYINHSDVRKHKVSMKFRKARATHTKMSCLIKGL